MVTGRNITPTAPQAAQRRDWSLELGSWGTLLAAAVFGGVLWSINGGFSVLGLETVACRCSNLCSRGLDRAYGVRVRADLWGNRERGAQVTEMHALAASWSGFQNGFVIGAFVVICAVMAVRHFLGD